MPLTGHRFTNALLLGARLRQYRFGLTLFDPRIQPGLHTLRDQFKAGGALSDGVFTQGQQFAQSRKAYVVLCDLSSDEYARSLFVSTRCSAFAQGRLH